MSDASAIVELLLRTPRAGTLERVMADPDADVHVPALCDVEVASALRRLRLSKALSERRRNQALADYVDLSLSRHGHLALLPRVLDLGPNLSAYDGVCRACRGTRRRPGDGGRTARAGRRGLNTGDFARNPAHSEHYYSSAGGGYRAGGKQLRAPSGPSNHPRR